MASSSRTVFVDVDGTILAHGSVIAPSTAEAVRRARANGHLVLLCTGRSAADIHPRVRQIGFDGAISNGGAFASCGERRIVERLIPRADAELIAGFFESHGIAYFLQADEAVYASPRAAAFAEDHFRSRRERQRAELAARGFEIDGSEPVIRHRPLEEADFGTIAKAVFVSDAPDALARTQRELGGRFHVIPGSIPLAGGSNGEIGLIGVHKGSAILAVLAALGRSPADAVGIGDSWNDVEMFEVVGTAVAMADADPALRARADRVTTGVLDDGVWNALDALGLL